MLQMSVITLREGVEAFLIVAITLAYLRKTGRDGLVPTVYAATAVAAGASFAAGWLFSRAANQPLWEGLLALVAAAMVLSMVVYMMRAAKRMRADIQQRVDSAAARQGRSAKFALFAFVLLMIVREGMELALVVVSLATQAGMADMLAGALLGVLGAALLAWAWARWGHRVNLARFFQVTSCFLVLFAAQLAFYAFHELTEAAALPLDNEYWHLATEPWAPEGQYGQYVGYALVAIPLAWLALAWLRERLRAAALAQKGA